MWWSTSVSERPVGVPRSAVPTEALLTELGLAPVEGIWCDAGHTIGVVRCPAGLFIGWLDVGWITPKDPFSEMRDVAHIVESVPSEQLLRDIRFAIDEAECVRADHLRTCRRCAERYVPGQMYGADCCHSCAVHDGDVTG